VTFVTLPWPVGGSQAQKGGHGRPKKTWGKKGGGERGKIRLKRWLVEGTMGGRKKMGGIELEVQPAETKDSVRGP